MCAKKNSGSVFVGWATVRSVCAQHERGLGKVPMNADVRMTHGRDGVELHWRKASKSQISNRKSQMGGAA